MKTLIAVFQLPIVLLNSLGFIISAIWLLVIGQWGSVVAGIVIAMVAPTLLAFAVLPGVLLAGPAVYFGNKGLTIGVYFFGFLASIFIYVLITTWCGGVTFYFLRDIPFERILAGAHLVLWSSDISLELHGAKRPIPNRVLGRVFRPDRICRGDLLRRLGRRYPRRLSGVLFGYDGRRCFPHAPPCRGLPNEQPGLSP